jgi:ribosomal-protein-alanine acetyltransferase
VIISLRPCVQSDGPLLAEIERECFPHPNWTAEDILRHRCTVADMDGQIAGFLSSRQLLPGTAAQPAEREILNLAVRPQYRGLGIATKLLQNELQQKATHFLEVRESNAAARQLYRKLGFIEIGRRPNYYSFPLEAAIVMQMK